METQQSIVIPHEDDELEIIASTQGVHDVQMETAKILGIAAHKVVCKVRRIGGGFGGKESTGVISCVPAALAARKLETHPLFQYSGFPDYGSPLG